MPLRAFGKLVCVLAGFCVVLGSSADVLAGPIKTIGQLDGWEVKRTADLPKSLQEADPNAVIIAADTVEVLPDMLVKMENVILNLTDDGTNVRLAELYSSVLPDAKAGNKAAPKAVHEFVIGLIREKLQDGPKVPIAELEVLVEAVEEGPAKDFVNGLSGKGTEVALGELLGMVEKSDVLVRDFFRPTVMTHLEHGRSSCLSAYCRDAADPWSVSLAILQSKAEKQPKAVEKYLEDLPVFVIHHRMAQAAPDVPLHQLLDMLSRSRTAYGKLIKSPLATEKDFDAPAKVAFMLQEAYARSEQINMDLVGRDVVGVCAVATLVLLLSGLVGYIRMLNVPNRRITE